ncbi:MAG: histidine kinase [Rikenellaceae bacterium]
MKISSKIVVDILIAVAISLVVNFSHLLLIFVDQDPQSSAQRREGADPNLVRVEGLFQKSPDGHGYVVYDDADSAYLSQGKVNRYGLKGGDSVLAVVYIMPDTVSPGRASRHSVVQNIYRSNGRIVSAYSSTTPQRVSEFITQSLYYFILSLVVILVATARWARRSRRGNFRMLLFALLIAIVMYLFAPIVSPRNRGDLIFELLLRGMPIIDYMVILKWSFAVVVSMLYSQIYTLLSQRQNIILENERLRSESINAQYNMLMSQINPHVLFNSLNSLSMLVRQKDEERSLTYIDQLSYTFRYILQNRESTLTSLDEEMQFVQAYIYLFKIRYADKLFFDIDIDPRYDGYQIPALSLQPLLDNAVKHNTIVSSRPFHVVITIEDDAVVVSNRKYPKLEAEPSTGVGLENLSRRWQLIANNPIIVENSQEHFTVRLPLIPPRK